MTGTLVHKCIDWWPRVCFKGSAIQLGRKLQIDREESIPFRCLPCCNQWFSRRVPSGVGRVDATRIIAAGWVVNDHCRKWREIRVTHVRVRSPLESVVTAVALRDPPTGDPGTKLIFWGFHKYACRMFPPGTPWGGEDEWAIKNTLARCQRTSILIIYWVDVNVAISKGATSSRDRSHQIRKSRVGRDRAVVGLAGVVLYLLQKNKVGGIQVFGNMSGNSRELGCCWAKVVNLE